MEIQNYWDFSYTKLKSQKSSDEKNKHGEQFRFLCFSVK